MLCFSSVSTSCEDCFLFAIHNKHKLKTLKLKIILDDTVKYILIHCPSLLPHRRRLLRNVTSFLGCSRGNKFLTSFPQILYKDYKYSERRSNWCSYSDDDNNTVL